MILTKTCSKCKKEKPVSEFSQRKRSKDGYYAWCKDCAKAYQAAWYLKNKETVDEKHRKYRIENLEERRAYSKRYYNRPETQKRIKEYNKQNIERRREYAREYRKKNLEHIREKSREYYHNNKDKAKIWRSKYESSHKEQIKKAAKKYRRENKEKINQNRIDRLHNDPVYKMKEQTRNMLRYALRSKGHRKTSRTADIIGCNLDFLCEYLFKTWEKNYGRPWDGEPYHIDHIVPLATAKTKKDIMKLCHYTNLQMLTPEDNMAKSDKV